MHTNSAISMASANGHIADMARRCGIGRYRARADIEQDTNFLQLQPQIFSHWIPSMGAMARSPHKVAGTEGPISRDCHSPWP
jgi:hypothetical protein